MASSFVPKDRRELLLRTPLTFGFAAPTDVYQPRNSQGHLSSRGDEFRSDESRERQRAKIKKMSRNTPHTGRVKPMRGLTEDQICSVEDNLARPRPMSALSNRDLGSGYKPPGSSRYSSNTKKQLFAVGVVPVTYAWREELMRKTKRAIGKALGEDPLLSRPLSRQSSRGVAKQFDHLDDKALLDMLCGILQTNSIPKCKDWLDSAPEDQKDIVLNMVRMAVLEEDDDVSGGPDLTSRPPSRYVWRPPTTQRRRYSDPLVGESLEQLSLDNTHPRYLFTQQRPPGLPRIGEGEQKSLVSEKRERKLKKTQSQDAATQIDSLQKDVYSALAPSGVRRSSKQREMERVASERDRTGGRKVNRDEKKKEAGTLPPLTTHSLAQSKELVERKGERGCENLQERENDVGWINLGQIKLLALYLNDPSCCLW